MQLRRYSTGQPIDLAQAPLLGEGGQARVYAVSAELVAKVYHRPSEAQARRLFAMLQSPPVDPSAPSGHVSIAWPVDVLADISDARRVVGALMPRVAGMRPAFEFFNPRSRRQHCPLFSYEYLHRAARNLAVAAGGVHARGHIIGDLNESNVLLRDDALVTLVDTDSFQVCDPAGGDVHRCPVGKAEFTPPELQGKAFDTVDRTPAHDRFALAVLIFQLLMEGTHPFMGEYQGEDDAPPLERRIAVGHFPHATGVSVPYRPPRHAPHFETLPPMLQALFARCFRDGHAEPDARPDAQQWQGALRAAESLLVTCPANAQHRYGGHLERCPWCARAEQLGGRDPFPSRAAVERGEVARWTAPPVQVALPPAGVPGAPVPAAASPAPPARHAHRRAAVRAGAARLASRGAPGQTLPARYPHLPWLAAAVLVTLFTLALSAVLPVLLGVALAGVFVATGWRRLRSARPGGAHAWTIGMGAAGVLLGCKVLATALIDPEPDWATRLPATSAGMLAPALPPDESVDPPRARSVASVQAVSAGAEHSCAITRSRRLLCWGANAFGQLGIGAEDQAAHPSPLSVVRMWFSSISTGAGGHTCGVLMGGMVYCWGRNDRGQLGLRYQALTPTPTGMHAAAVATGGLHTCVLTETREIRCVGANEYGQLGDGTLDDRRYPWDSAVDSLRFQSVAAGAAHSCGIAEDGTAYCWGLNAAGQLGTRAPRACRAANGAPLSCSPVPVAVGGGHREACERFAEETLHDECERVVNAQLRTTFRMLTAGTAHTCGISAEGQLFCWGLDDQGQLGSARVAEECGDTGGRAMPCRRTPAPVVVSPELRFTQVSAGHAHTCALTSEGRAYCWGSNRYGQLGVESDSEECGEGGARSRCSTTPLLLGNAPRLIAISAGRRHTCGLTRGHRTVCWGGNERGQLGTGSDTEVMSLGSVLGARGIPGASELGDGDDDNPRFEFQVSKPVYPTAGNPVPSYPARLRDAGVEGEVLAQFVVDTAGYAEMETFKVLKSDDELFTASVRDVLPLMRFEPAEHDGRKVRQLVQQAFPFRLQ